MNKKIYPDVKTLQNKITSDGTVHLTYHAEDIHDIIHPYSVPGYEYLAAGFVEFMDRFRPIVPKKIPIILEIKGKYFNSEQKKAIDNAVWTQYGLYLSEADDNLKKIRIRMSLFFLLMVISSILLFVVAGNSNEVITNYGYILFWFFGYRVLTHLLLDYLPIYREYQWYRRLAAVKLIFSDEDVDRIDSLELSQEIHQYEKEADQQTRNHHFVDHVLLDESGIALGCRITEAETVLVPSGAEDLEILSDEMADYLMSALPFIKQKYVTKLEIEGGPFSDEDRGRLTKAIRNHLGFVICGQDSEQKVNRKICTRFTIGLLLSTLLIYIWGKEVNVAVHEFIIMSFWFFADYLLDFVLLAGTEIWSKKKTLEKLAEMDIFFKE